MSRWIDNSLADRLYMVNLVSETKNIDPESVEKDWWVTMVLKAVFGMSMARYAYFKGGTSLSKAWNLINRFSEDIDIALYREFFLTERDLACARCENNNQVKMLRKASHDYIHGEFKTELEQRTKEMGLNVSVEAVSEYTIYLYREKVDIRKGINGLSGIVRNEMKLNPYTSKSIYVFSGRNPRLKKAEECLRMEGESITCKRHIQ